MANADRPNVVLLVMDTARARSVFFEDAPSLPVLSGLMDEGTTFTRAFADAPWTLPSHASLFTGTSPSYHGAHAGHKQLADDPRTLAETLADAGYHTAAVTNNAWVTSEFGMTRGFEDRYRVWQYFQSDYDVGPVVMQESGRDMYLDLLARLQRGNPIKNVVNALYGRFRYRRDDYGAARTNEMIRRWTTDARAPFFLFVNYLEPHLEYRPPAEFATRFLDCSYSEAMDVTQDPWEYICGVQELNDRDLAILEDLYRAEIAYLDSRIGEVVELLKESGHWSDTILIVVGDHGENIGDHGLMDHQYCLYDTLLHVPLVVAGGPFDGGGTVDRLVQLSDVFPTLYNVLGLDDERAVEQFQGQSFAAGATERNVAISEYLAPQPSIETLRDRFGHLPERVERFERRLRAIRTDDWKLIRGTDGSLRLYDVRVDPHEDEDVSAENSDVVDNLTGRLDEWLDGFDHANTAETVDIAAGTERRLADLGYL